MFDVGKFWIQKPYFNLGTLVQNIFSHDLNLINI